MAHYDTSNARDSQINNIAGDQVSLIIHHHYHVCSDCQSRLAIGLVAGHEAAGGSSSAGARDRASDETRATVEESEVADSEGSGSLQQLCNKYGTLPNEAEEARRGSQCAVERLKTDTLRRVDEGRASRCLLERLRDKVNR
ncbi:hypothetical protein FIBSPDRAFT_890277 [Athelia psychrophila]|uniref:Uncharacterized protein n=1 Tax=Athelia psychrophila TaxID=1759441 RepID=A0A166L7G8_9AGAM|nr:hypothetical protein FIBSPDRAFT_890277 [Fibularhizoctonia sp. CBS 109695]